MPILKPTNHYGTAVALLINKDRATGLTSQPISDITVTLAGFEGEAHGGLTRSSCVRVVLQYPRNTIIRNSRQVTIVSQEELDEIAVRMGIARVEPGWIGANLVVSGIPQLTKTPPSSRLIFDGGVSLVIDMENGPCAHAGDVIEKHVDGISMAFTRAAHGRRGVTAWVESAGTLRTGEKCRLHSPTTDVSRF